MIPGKQLTPEDVLAMLWRRKWLVVVPFVLIGAAALVVVQLLPDSYRSETMILVVPQRVPDSYVRSTVSVGISDRLQSISPQILSRPRLERVISDFDLFAEFRKSATMDDTVELMRRQIEIQVVKGDAFRIGYVADSPETAMRVTDRLSALFIEENLRDRELLAEGTNQFIESQLEDARRSLKEQEVKLEAYRRQHPTDMPAQLNSNLQAKHNAEMQVQAVVDSLAAERDRRMLLERQIAELQSREAAPPPSVVSASPAAEQLATARATLRDLEARYTSEHPDVVRARRLLGDLEKRAGSEASTPSAAATPAPPPPSSAAESWRLGRLLELQQELEKTNRQIAGKEDHEKSLRALIVQYQSRVEAVPARESELAELTRDYDTIQSLYRSLLAKKEDSRIAANLERQQVGEQFKVIEPANLPDKPFTPNRLRLSLMGIFAGLAFGLVLAAAAEYMDTSMRSESDVISALDLPVLATIPLIRRETSHRGWRRMVAVMVLAGPVAGLIARLRS